jgi:SAM-dependent methyltransferase
LADDLEVNFRPNSVREWYVIGHDQLIASPHPLDFDWRFDEPTIAKLYEALRTKNVLALGAPSIARRLEANGGQVLLVDRQPVQGVQNQLVADVSTLEIPRSDFDIVIADPPWYPRYLNDWASIGGRFVRPGGEVLISVWPPETRPGAAVELSCTVARFGEWADVTELLGELTYDAPPFERIANSISHNHPLARSPRHGCLLRLQVHRRPEPPPCRNRPALWHRFFVDGYQLAVRLSPSIAAKSPIVSHPEAKNWLWPYVSARAPGLDRIGIWSSAAEVGQVGDPEQLISVLRQALHAANPRAFEASLATVPELIGWKIPRPPYQRVVEWQHP